MPTESSLGASPSEGTDDETGTTSKTVTHSSTMTETVPPWVNVLLAVAVSAILLAIVGFGGWWWSSRQPIEVQDLDRDDRQRLVEEILTFTGRSQAPAWYEPALAYTLIPDKEMDVWGARFSTNSMGYRSGPIAKKPDTFRVLFLGDSWTYGMGVSYEESFPVQFAELATAKVAKGEGAKEEGAKEEGAKEEGAKEEGGGGEIESWSLALPGYNSVNYLTALEIHIDSLQPDMVVICPTRNDNDSNYFIMPDGSNRRASGHLVDRYGDDQGLMYRYRYLDSYRYLERWKKVFAGFAETSSWLQDRGIPVAFFFVAHWEPSFVHYQWAEAGLSVPYAIGPQAVTSSPWRGPPPFFHGTPEAYGQYARMVYRLVTGLAGWPELEIDESDKLDVGYFTAAPKADWDTVQPAIARWFADLPTRFEPGGKDERPCPSDLDCRSGNLGRNGTLLLKRQPGKTRLRLTVQRLEGYSSLYPLAIRATIPTAAGGETAQTTILSTGPPTHTFELDLPSTIPNGSVLEIELQAAAARLASDVKALRSLMLVSAEQI